MTIEADLTNAIAVLEFSNDIIHRPFGDTALNEERQGWPDIHGLPCIFA